MYLVYIFDGALPDLVLFLNLTPQKYNHLVKKRPFSILFGNDKLWGDLKLEVLCDKVPSATAKILVVFFVIRAGMRKLPADYTQTDMT